MLYKFLCVLQMGLKYRDNKVTDKRVSRSHAVLELNDDKLSIKPIHSNPTFHKKNGSPKLSPLEKDEWKELSDGDQLSLLPKDLIFAVSCKHPEQNEEKKENQSIAQNKLVEDMAVDNHLKDSSCDIKNGNQVNIGEIYPKRSGKVDGAKDDVVDNDQESKMDTSGGPSDSSPVKSKEQPEIQDSTSEEADPSCTPKKTEVTKLGKVSKANSSQINVKEKKRILPGWMASAAASSGASPPAKKQKTTQSKAKKKAAEKEPDFIDDDEDDADLPVTLSTGKNTRKTSIEPKATPSKAKNSKQRTSASSTIYDREAVQTLDDEKEPDKKDTKKHSSKTQDDNNESKTLDDKSFLSGQGTQQKVDKKDKVEKKTKESKKLPKCPYGKKCYRKNPAHFQEYSHPGSDESDSDDNESDDGNNDKPECPYGTSCYRQNPQHRNEYKHTEPPASSSGQSQSQSQRNQRSKRTRKATKKSVLDGDSDDEGGPNTYDYDDSFLDDDDISEESASYGDDSEDPDYDPGEDDDVGDLVSEAKSFIKNKKMHKK